MRRGLMLTVLFLVVIPLPISARELCHFVAPRTEPAILASFVWQDGHCSVGVRTDGRGIVVEACDEDWFRGALFERIDIFQDANGQVIYQRDWMEVLPVRSSAVQFGVRALQYDVFWPVCKPTLALHVPEEVQELFFGMYAIGELYIPR
jgi:hypothetical protein